MYLAQISADTELTQNKILVSIYAGHETHGRHHAHQHRDKDCKRQGHSQPNITRPARSVPLWFKLFLCTSLLHALMSSTPSFSSLLLSSPSSSCSPWATPSSISSSHTDLIFLATSSSFFTSVLRRCALITVLGAFYMPLPKFLPSLCAFASAKLFFLTQASR